MKAIIIAFAVAVLTFAACDSPSDPSVDPTPPPPNRLLVYGTVTDLALHIPIPGARVDVIYHGGEGASWQTNANDQGEYRIEIDNPEAYLGCAAEAGAWVDGYKVKYESFTFDVIPKRVDLAIERE